MWCEMEEADAWWIELAIGGMDVLLGKLPFAFPRIGWAREFKGKPEPRFWDMNTLAKKLYG